MRTVTLVSADNSQPHVGAVLAGKWRVVRVVDRVLVGGRAIWQVAVQPVRRVVTSEALAV